MHGQETNLAGTTRFSPVLLEHLIEIFDPDVFQRPSHRNIFLISVVTMWRHDHQIPGVAQGGNPQELTFNDLRVPLDPFLSMDL